MALDFITKNANLLIEVLAVILIITGIALIYVPAAFILSGIALLLFIHAKETVNDVDSNTD